MNSISTLDTVRIRPPLKAGRSLATLRPAGQRALRFGVGLRRQHFDDIAERLGELDFLEILPENFMYFGGRPARVLEEAARRVPVLSHGVSLSLGGPDPLDTDYLARLKELVTRLDSPWFSDHLSYSSAFGVEYHDLIPMPFTEEAIRHVVERIRYVQDFVGRPMAVENPSYYMTYADSDMTEAQFVAEVVERSGCLLLLDINNVFVNASNHGYDARAFLDAMDGSKVVQYHMAGHVKGDDFLIDTHSMPIAEDVLDLYAHALLHLGPAWTLLEWDNAIPSLDALLKELDRVRRVASALDASRLAAWAQEEGRVS